MSAYVYIVECADGTLYTGWTDDVAKRVAAHNAGRGAKYTRSRRPVVLRYYEELEDKSSALSREAAIKRLSRAAKQQLIATAVIDNGGKSIYND
ncbi:MAG: GIY-YIG nuclease family protein [Veillonellaceae bacterium]|nr:GIY-YIG nuclease family protein [Veillonellaceae bacterium]MDD6922942.1 GIY-YIG nuclease family protein [Veillonellaceae bacterium]